MSRRLLFYYYYYFNIIVIIEKEVLMRMSFVGEKISSFISSLNRKQNIMRNLMTIIVIV